MKPFRLPLIVLALIIVVFVYELRIDGQRLPGMVATHFNGDGVPNQYMTRASHLKNIGFLGIGIALGEVLLFFGMRYIKGDRINIPNRDYWLAPERRETTLNALTRQGLWLSCLTLTFFGIVEHVLVIANAEKPAHLSTTLIMAPALVFMASVLGWIVALLLKFSRVPAGR